MAVPPSRVPRFRSSAAGLLLLLVLVACEAPSPPPPAVPVVTVEAVQIRDLPLRLRYPARVVGSRVVEIRAQVNGEIVERAYREGQPVEKGDVLFRINPAPYQAVYDQAAAQVAVQQATLSQAETEFSRVEALVEGGAVSRREFDQAKAALQQARAGMAAAEATRRSARLNLDYTQVRAPVDGVASKEAVTAGNLVSGGGGAGGDLLTSIIQSDPAYVEFSVPEPEFLRLRDGAQLQAEGLQVSIVAGSSCDLHGRVDFADAFVNPATGTLRLRAVFDNPDRCLVSGQFLEVEVEGLTLTDRLALPKTAVQFGQRGALAWVIGPDNIAERRALKVIESWRDHWIVEGPLKAGERVVTEGVLKVSDGKRVDVRQPDTPPPEADGGA
ncbi:efflux RND transporter periplasmic adaptor subunit [Flagellatimonas centrodinii]|uniref:efflux RND transporter periplasmic adaptor subunit n=1 Tax=Flagellatimonas centrodinii TaxID=2806210 RepID=UPI001FF971C4|nr:efflux RND transporter periplasmic adaptor subunit [Flagellatimonas centrodinii]ULQ46596.1 efflux RND transporter periplasmic adaptor subunit [Flagellatimonas centrodinii]